MNNKLKNFLRNSKLRSKLSFRYLKLSFRSLKKLDYKYYLGLRPKGPLGPVGILIVGVLIVGGAIFILRAPKTTEASWWNDSWYYRQQFDVYNNEASPLTDFQVAISTSTLQLATLNSEGKTNSDFSDLRFTDASGNLLDYWFEEDTDTMYRVYVKFPNLPASATSTMFMYYGNPSASDERDGEEVFEVYEDFSSLPSDWTAESSDPENWEIVNGELKTTGSGYASFTKDSPNFTDFIVEVDWQSNNIENSNYHGGLVFRGQEDAANASYQWIFHGPSGNRIQLRTPNQTYPIPEESGTTKSNNTWYYLKLKVGGTLVETYIDNIENVSGDMSDTTYTTGKLGFQHYNNINYFDDYRVSKYTATEPTITTTSGASEERGPAPVGYWSFDEGYGSTAHDNTSNANDGTITGATWQNEDQCIAGKCLWFDGDDDYIEISDIFTPTSFFTLSVWVKKDISQSGYKAVISTQPYSSSDNFGIWSYNDNWHFQVFGDNNISINSAISYNEWTNLVLVYGGVNPYVSIYINGILVDSSTSNPGTLISRALTIGSYNSANYFNGFIDEVKIYPYARTEAQIKADYNAGLAGVSSRSGINVAMGGQSNKSLSDGLIAYWKMDESSWSGVADEVIDASGNANHGVAVNGATTTSTAKYAMAGEFDGDNDYVDLGTPAENFTIGDYHTITAWVKRDNSCGNGYNSVAQITETASPYEAWELYLRKSDGAIGRYISGDGGFKISSVNLVPNDTWTFITIVGYRDSSNGYSKISMNGGELETIFSGDTDDEMNITSLTPANIGRWTGNNHNFCGSIDEVRIYNRALSPREIKQLYEYAPGPVGYWDFEENEGTTLYDKSGNENHGTLTNMDASTDWVRGKYGGGLDFDGNNDYVEADNFSIGESLTISAWGYSNDYDATMLWNFSRDVNDKLDLYFKNNTISLNDGDGTSNAFSNSSFPSTEEWHHYGVTVDKQNNTSELYIDGAYVGSANYKDPTTTNDQLQIGCYNSYGYNWNGMIDDVRIYNYARTPKQILEDMNGGRPAINSPIGYWSFDEGHGSTVNDSGLGGNDGTIIGADWTSEGRVGKALDFSDENDEVDLGDVRALDPGEESYTWTAWLKFSGYTGANRQIYCANAGGGDLGFGIKLDDDSNSLRYEIYGSSGGRQGSPSMTVNVNDYLNEWHHYTFVLDPSDYSVKIYVDADLKRIDNLSAWGSIDSSTNVKFGEYISWDYDGLIDELKIFNYALSEDEVKQEYNQGKSMTLGSGSTESDGTTPSNSSDRSYCVPGDTATCNPPVAEWKFDEKTGDTAYDTSGNGNDGTLTNMEEADWTRGKVGSALEFDGVEEYVDIDESSFDLDSVFGSNNTDFTLFLWINPLDITSDETNHNVRNVVFGNSGDSIDDNFELGIYNDIIDVYTELDGVDTTLHVDTDISLNNWYYLTIKKSSSDGLEVYKNGLLIYSDETQTGSFTVSSGQGFDLTIGKSNHIDTYFNGLIDQVQIYDYARTPAQIAWDYNKGAPIAHWSFDEGEGSTAHDETDNLNHGTLTNMDSADWLDSSDCIQGNCLDFDGSDDYVDCGSANDYDNAEGSTSLWFNTSSADLNFFMGDRDASGPYFQTWIQSGIVQARIFNGSSSYNTDYSYGGFADGSWHHLVVTWGADGLQVYVDGEFIGSNSYTGTWVTDSNMRLASVEAYQGTYNLDGKLDEVKIFNYALTPVQIQQDYNLGKGVYFK